MQPGLRPIVLAGELISLLLIIPLMSLAELTPDQCQGESLVGMVKECAGDNQDFLSCVRDGEGTQCWCATENPQIQVSNAPAITFPPLALFSHNDPISAPVDGTRNVWACVGAT